MSVSAYLILSVALFLLMIVVQGISSISSQPLGTLVGARDDMTDKTVFAGRARRANANMVEAMIMFVPLALLSIHHGIETMPTAAGAALFFFGRLAFAPLYWFGVAWLRTVAWAVSVVGLLMMLINLLPLI